MNECDVKNNDRVLDRQKMTQCDVQMDDRVIGRQGMTRCDLKWDKRDWQAEVDKWAGSNEEQNKVTTQ